MALSINPRQKLFIAVFTCAAIGLLLDRTLLSPSQAEESSQESSPAQSHALLLNLQNEGDYEVPGAKLTEQLNQLVEGIPAPSDKMRDAFKLPEAWYQSVNGTSGLTQSQRAAAFTHKYQLKAIITLAANEQRAFVNDLMIAVGESLDGYTLTALGDETATFEQDDEVIILKLSEVP